MYVSITVGVTAAPTERVLIGIARISPQRLGVAAAEETALTAHGEGTRAALDDYKECECYAHKK